jgi:hypothetical protein
MDLNKYRIMLKRVMMAHPAIPVHMGSIFKNNMFMIRHSFVASHSISNMISIRATVAET